MKNKVLVLENAEQLKLMSKMEIIRTPCIKIKDTVYKCHCGKCLRLRIIR